MSYKNAVDLGRALQTYNNSVAGSSTRINKVLSETSFRKGSFDTIFPTMFSLHSRDIFTAINSAVKNNKLTNLEQKVIIKAYKLTISNMSKEFPLFSEADANYVVNKLKEFILVFNENENAGTISTSTISKLEKIQLDIRKIFSTPKVVYYVPSEADSIGSIKLAFYSFKNLRDIINIRLKKNIDIVASTEEQDTSRIDEGSYLTTEIVNYGHTLVETDSGQQLITSKLLASLISLGNELTEDRAKLISTDFINYTKQYKTKIEMHQGIDPRGSAVFKLIVDSGFFQSTIVQSQSENQGELSKLEKAWNFTEFVGRNKGFLPSLGFKDVRSFLSALIKVKASPSLSDKIAAKIISSISGTAAKNISVERRTLVNSSINIPAVALKKVTINRGIKPISGPKLKLISGTASLASLENILRARLSEQIKKNMGTGASKNILNYRTGRFADTVKIDRLTAASRQGMISVFYEYMKNPYATFSEGGAQQWPKTRDPKTLISKSIREIGITLAKNKMRAISV